MVLIANSNDNFDRRDPPKQSSGFGVGNKAFHSATIVTAASTLLILFAVLYAFDLNIQIEQGDIQTLAEVVMSAGAIALAVPLFLKEIRHANVFWKQFFLLGFIFILAGLLSFICLLELTAKSEGGVEVSFYMVCAFTSSVTIHAIPSLKYFWERLSQSRVSVNINVPLTHFLSIIALLLCLINVSNHHLVALFYLLTFYGFYITLVIFIAIIIELSSNRSTDFTIEHRIKQAIEDFVETNRGIALTVNQVLNGLRKKPFAGRQEIVNEEIITRLVNEMSAETGDAPKVSSHYGHVWPRWKADYEPLLRDAEPKMIAMKRDYTLGSITDIEKKYGETILSLVEASSGLSGQLLKDRGFSLGEKYRSIYTDREQEIILIADDDTYISLMRLRGQVYSDASGVNIESINQVYDIFRSRGHAMNHIDLKNGSARFMDIESIAKRLLPLERVLSEIKERNTTSNYTLAAELATRLFPGLVEELNSEFTALLRRVLEDRVNILHAQGKVEKSRVSDSYSASNWKFIHDSDEEEDDDDETDEDEI